MSGRSREWMGKIGVRRVNSLFSIKKPLIGKKGIHTSDPDFPHPFAAKKPWIAD
jgi:hypothetical protein